MRFAREGAKVLCVDRSGRSHETVDLITREGGDAKAFRADVTVANEVQNMVAYCVERFGRVDILHNNVGIDRVGGLVETTEASWDEVIRINLTSQFLTCKYILPVMERQRAGVIIKAALAAPRRQLTARPHRRRLGCSTRRRLPRLGRSQLHQRHDHRHRRRTERDHGHLTWCLTAAARGQGIDARGDRPWSAVTEVKTA